VGRTRASGIWSALVGALVFLVALIVFIAENGRRSDISFVGLHAHLPLGLALLIAAVAGGVIVGLAGSVRIVQLRRTAGRHRRSDQVIASADVPPPGLGQGPDPAEPASDDER